MCGIRQNTGVDTIGRRRAGPGRSSSSGEAVTVASLEMIKTRVSDRVSAVELNGELLILACMRSKVALRGGSLEWWPHSPNFLGTE